MSAELVDLDDGEKGVRAEIELFDEDTEPGDPRRAVPLKISGAERFTVEYDRTVALNDPEGDVAALAEIARSPAQRSVKKSLEPIAELILEFGALALGAIAAGALAKVGADGWDALKKRLKRRYRNRSHDELFVTRFGVARPEPLEVLVVLANPSEADLEGYLEFGIQEVDELVDYVLAREADIVRIVLHWTNSELRLGWAQRRDAVPILIDPALIPPLPDEWK